MLSKQYRMFCRDVTQICCYITLHVMLQVHSLDFKSSEYVAIHSKAIRDFSFNTRSPDAVLLSCSMDKTIKMTSLISNTITHSYVDIFCFTGYVFSVIDRWDDLSLF